LLVIDENDPAAWALYTLSSVTDNTTNLTLAVTAIGANGTFSGNVSLTFANKGNTGATGAAGATGATGSVSSASGLTLTETTTPSTPSANDLILFVDSTDGLLKQKNDAGAVSLIGGGGGGGGQYEYVGTVTAAGGESYLEFTGLTESHYSLFGTFQLSVSTSLSVFANGNTTQANYRRQRITAYGTALSAAATSVAYAGYSYNSPAPFGNLYLNLGREPNGFFYAHCESAYSDNGFTSIEKEFTSIYSDSTIVSLTSIRFTPLSGTFSAGSVFYLYKLVTA
jgi:hypothetical protein